ncbi:Asp-tRNA(Asn)/Glu-tRNA(Gln) amidotransferase subunit GatC, partial [bacterium]|nr:Asp-tRNA(Asn)/Glu-tRNA(Gln) amidotransferase subunit GatC [bacterium]
MLNKEAVLKVAKLARLNISEQEAQDYQKQLEKVLDSFQKIAVVNTDGVEPLVTPTPVDLFMREDEVQQLVTVDEIIKCAPDAKGNLFKV